MKLNHAQLPAARNAYRYPAAHLKVPAGAAVCFDNLQFYRPAENIAPEGSGQFQSMWELEDYHHTLLNSDEVEQVVLGLASVIYWGNYSVKGTSRHTLGQARVRHFFLGKVGGLLSIETFTRAQALDAVRAAADCLQNDDFAGALRRVCTLPRLGPSFGSKVLAFMCPERVGVYDLHMSRLMLGESSKAVHGNHAKVFAFYCGLLNEKAAQLNGLGCQWQDWDGSLHRWRAVDVERACFHLALNGGFDGSVELGCAGSAQAAQSEISGEQATPMRQTPAEAAANRMITLRYDGGREFALSALIEHLEREGRQSMVVGAQQVPLATHTKPHSLDHWLRSTVAHSKDTMQAGQEVVDQLCDSGCFRRVRLECPETGRCCKGIERVGRSS